MRACSCRFGFLFHDKDWGAEPSESTRFGERLVTPVGSFLRNDHPGGISKLVLEISSTLDLISISISGRHVGAG